MYHLDSIAWMHGRLPFQIGSRWLRLFVSLGMNDINTGIRISIGEYCETVADRSIKREIVVAHDLEHRPVGSG